MTLGGAPYFWRGLGLLRKPGIRAFVIVPLAINLLLFALTTALLVDRLGTLFDWTQGQVGDWFAWLIGLLWLVVAALWLLIYGYSFALISNLIASPFYGLLAERVEQHLRGETRAEPLTAAALLALTRRTLARELHKIAYFLPRLLGVVALSLVLSLIPGLGLLAPVLYFAWGAWSLALQNVDFAADNNGTTFPVMRRHCAGQRGLTLSFGALTMATFSVPLLNLVAVPAAVAGATALWVERLDKGESRSAPMPA